MLLKPFLLPLVVYTAELSAFPVVSGNSYTEFLTQCYLEPEKLVMNAVEAGASREKAVELVAELCGTYLMDALKVGVELYFEASQ